MTNAEMNRRLATMTEDQIGDIEWYIRQGFGAHGIKCETPYSLKQINAVFQKIEEERAAYRRSCDWERANGFPVMTFEEWRQEEALHAATR